MSIPNAIRDNSDSYFLEEDVDITVWISKIAVDISRLAFMAQMKTVFRSHDNFDTAFSGFSKDLLQGSHQQSQNTISEKLPKGPDFLALVLEHCSLTREQIYTCIIPYMIQHEEKRPCSGAGSECATYMHLNQRPPASNKGKGPMTGSLQSCLSVHMPTPAKTGESIQQWLDADLDSYNQVHELVLPYEEAPPSSNPDVEMDVATVAENSGTLPDESTMYVDPELEDLYA
ncbi:hypothetical protein M422DRAFT_259520 [Sphaerobolus stellatus SS14]|uniref:Uncharacterized protein n=1 Tax=Sphaerobolus stellatus (strain SS14) TaxID=990650 RepID=A0A0C9USV8_SPHS4|nr:hypothetical protein M422DRAFT_259520 [Sphaerobolus stellatus SS14]